MCVCVCVCVDQTVSSPHPKRTHHTLSSPCTPHLLLLPPSLLLHSPARPPCLCVCVCVCARREADCVPEKPCDGCLECENNNKKSVFFLCRWMGFRIHPCDSLQRGKIGRTCRCKVEGRNRAGRTWISHLSKAGEQNRRGTQVPQIGLSTISNPLLLSPLSRHPCFSSIGLPIFTPSPGVLLCSQNSLTPERSVILFFFFLFSKWGGILNFRGWLGRRRSWIKKRGGRGGPVQPQSWSSTHDHAAGEGGDGTRWIRGAPGTEVSVQARPAYYRGSPPPSLPLHVCIHPKPSAPLSTWFSRFHNWWSHTQSADLRLWRSFVINSFCLFYCVSISYCRLLRV